MERLWPVGFVPQWLLRRSPVRRSWGWLTGSNRETAITALGRLPTSGLDQQAEQSNPRRTAK